MKAGKFDGTRPTVHASIDVPNLEQGLRFYREVFGFFEVARPFPAMAILDANNVTVCMHEKAVGTRSSPVGAATRHYDRHWTPVHLDYHVEDFEATVTKAIEAGASVEQQYNEPKAVAFCCDPFGNGFCVISK